MDDSVDKLPEIGNLYSAGRAEDSKFGQANPILGEDMDTKVENGEGNGILGESEKDDISASVDTVIQETTGMLIDTVTESVESHPLAEAQVVSMDDDSNSNDEGKEVVGQPRNKDVSGPINDVSEDSILGNGPSTENSGDTCPVNSNSIIDESDSQFQEKVGPVDSVPMLTEPKIRVCEDLSSNGENESIVPDEMEKSKQSESLPFMEPTISVCTDDDINSNAHGEEIMGESENKDVGDSIHAGIDESVLANPELLEKNGEEFSSNPIDGDGKSRDDDRKTIVDDEMDKNDSPESISFIPQTITRADGDLYSNEDGKEILGDSEYKDVMDSIDTAANETVLMNQESPEKNGEESSSNPTDGDTEFGNLRSNNDSKNIVADEMEKSDLLESVPPNELSGMQIHGDVIPNDGRKQTVPESKNSNVPDAINVIIGDNIPVNPVPRYNLRKRSYDYDLRKRDEPSSSNSVDTKGSTLLKRWVEKNDPNKGMRWLAAVTATSPAQQLGFGKRQKRPRLSRNDSSANASKQNDGDGGAMESLQQQDSERNLENVQSFGAGNEHANQNNEEEQKRNEIEDGIINVQPSATGSESDGRDKNAQADFDDSGSSGAGSALSNEQIGQQHEDDIEPSVAGSLEDELLETGSIGPDGSLGGSQLLSEKTPQQLENEEFEKELKIIEAKMRAENLRINLKPVQDNRSGDKKRYWGKIIQYEYKLFKTIYGRDYDKMRSCLLGKYNEEMEDAEVHDRLFLQQLALRERDGAYEECGASTTGDSLPNALYASGKMKMVKRKLEKAAVGPKGKKRKNYNQNFWTADNYKGKYRQMLKYVNGLNKKVFKSML